MPRRLPLHDPHGIHAREMGYARAHPFRWYVRRFDRAPEAVNAFYLALCSNEAQDAAGEREYPGFTTEAQAVEWLRRWAAKAPRARYALVDWRDAFEVREETLGVAPDAD